MRKILSILVISLCLTFTAITAEEKYDINIDTSELIKKFKVHVLEQINAPIDFIAVAEVEMSNKDKFYIVEASYKLKNDKGEEEIWIGRGKFTEDGVFIDLENDGPYKK